MILLPIDIEETRNNRFLSIPECIPVLKVYPDYYRKIGFNKPWIGYFATVDGEEIVGAAGYKGAPKGGKVEIAYGTFKNYEGKGIGTEICRQLVLLALQTDPAIRITARTFREGHASMAILKKNGFECLGIVYDEEDGDVFEWEFSRKSR
ncbi:MAG: GNAT family N-acetyltransferase [Bacteroidota bacterium]|nr:GNAT family N-acetyltransferase [Bacteroidota bacterium]